MSVTKELKMSIEVLRDRLSIKVNLYSKTAEDYLTRDQQAALTILNSGANVFLIGESGTGKSFLINRFKKLNKGKSILLTAPTGIAAHQIGGTTLHRAFKIPSTLLSHHEQLKHVKKISSLLKSTDIVSIDEISLCRDDEFSYVVRFISQENFRREHSDKKAPIQLICAGNFSHLPSVITTNEREYLHELRDNNVGFAFLNRIWNYMQIKTIVLTEVLRLEDNVFYSTQKNSRQNNEVKFDSLDSINNDLNEIDDTILLCSNKKLADDINYMRLQDLEGEEIEFRIQKKDPKKIIKHSDILCDEVLYLKKGARVMLIEKDNDGVYQNGALGTVVKIMRDEIRVLLDNIHMVVSIHPYKWSIFDYALGTSKDGEKFVFPREKASYTQFPLKLAYAIPLRKTQ